MAFFVAGRTAVNMGTPPFVATATAKKQQMMGLQTSSAEKRSLYRHSRISGFSAVRPTRSGSFSDYSSASSLSSSGAAVHHVITGISSAATTAAGVVAASAASASQSESAAAQDPLSVEALRASRRFDLLASSSDSVHSFTSRSDGSMSPISRSRRFDWLVEAASMDGSDDELDLDHHDVSQEAISNEPDGMSGTAGYNAQKRRDDAYVPTGSSPSAALTDGDENGAEDAAALGPRDGESGENFGLSSDEGVSPVVRDAKAATPNMASATVATGEHMFPDSRTSRGGVHQPSSEVGNGNAKMSEGSQPASSKPRSSSGGGKSAFEYGSGRFFSAGDYEASDRASSQNSDEAGKSNDDDEWKPVLGRREAAAEKKREAAAAKRRQQEAAAAARTATPPAPTPHSSAPAAKVGPQEVHEPAGAAQLHGDDRTSEEGEDEEGDEVATELAVATIEGDDENGSNGSSSSSSSSVALKKSRPVALSVAKNEPRANSSANEPKRTAALASDTVDSTDPTRPALRTLAQPTTGVAGNENPRTSKAKASSKATSRGNAGATTAGAATAGSEKEGSQKHGRGGESAGNYSSSGAEAFTTGGYDASPYASDLDAFAAAQQQQQQQHMAAVTAALTSEITDFVAWVDAQRAAQAAARSENMQRVRAAAASALGCASHSEECHMSNKNSLDETSHELEKQETSTTAAELHPRRRRSHSSEAGANEHTTNYDEDGFSLVEYGSTALGLSLPDSDLDLVLVLSPHTARQLASTSAAAATAAASSPSSSVAPPELHGRADSSSSSRLADSASSDVATREAAVAAVATPPETTPEPTPLPVKAPPSSSSSSVPSAASVDFDEDPAAWPADVRRSVQLACLDMVAEQLATQDWVTNLSVVRAAGVPVVRFLGLGGLRLDLSADLRPLRADQNGNFSAGVSSASNESKHDDNLRSGAESSHEVRGAHRLRLGHQGLRTKAYVAGRLGLTCSPDSASSSSSRNDTDALSKSSSISKTTSDATTASSRRRSSAGVVGRRRRPSRGHPSLRALTLVVKQLLADHGLSDKASGGLSGYGCFLVVDCFLVWHARTMRKLQRGEQPSWLGDDVASDSDEEFDDDDGRRDGEEVEEGCSLGWLLLAFLEQHATLVDCRRLAFTPKGYMRRTDGDNEALPPAMVVTDPAAASVAGQKQAVGNVARGLYRLSHLEGVLGLAWQCLGRGDGLAAVLTSRPVPQCRHLQ